MLWVLWIYWRLYKGLCASLGAHAAFCSFQKHIIFCSRSGIRVLVLTRHCLAERSRWIWPDPQNVETLFQFSALIFFFSLSLQVPTASVTVEGASALNRVRWSSGGKEVAVGDSEGRVWIYDTGEVRTTFSSLEINFERTLNADTSLNSWKF